MHAQQQLPSSSPRDQSEISEDPERIELAHFISRLLFGYRASWTRALGFKILRRTRLDVELLRESGTSDDVYTKLGVLLCAAIDGAGDVNEQMEALGLVRYWCIERTRKLVWANEDVVIACAALASANSASVSLSTKTTKRASLLALESIAMLAIRVASTTSSSHTAGLSASLNTVLEALMINATHGKGAASRIADFAIVCLLSTSRGRRDVHVRKKTSIAGLDATRMKRRSRLSTKAAQHLTDTEMALSPLLQGFIGAAIAPSGCASSLGAPEGAGTTTDAVRVQDEDTSDLHRCQTTLVRICSSVCGFLLLSSHCRNGSMGTTRSPLELLISSLATTRNGDCRMRLLNLIAALLHYSPVHGSSSHVSSTPLRDHEYALSALLLYSLHRVALPKVLVTIAIEQQHARDGALAVSLLAHWRLRCDTLLPESIKEKVVAAGDAAQHLLASTREHRHIYESLPSSGAAPAAAMGIGTVPDSDTRVIRTNTSVDMARRERLHATSATTTTAAAAIVSTMKTQRYGDDDVLDARSATMHAVIECDTQTLSGEIPLVHSIRCEAVADGLGMNLTHSPGVHVSSESRDCSSVNSVLAMVAASKVLGITVEHYDMWDFSIIAATMRAAASSNEQMVRLMKCRQFAIFMDRVALFFCSSLNRIERKSDLGVLVRDALRSFTEALLRTPRGVAFLGTHRCRPGRHTDRRGNGDSTGGDHSPAHEMESAWDGDGHDDDDDHASGGRGGQRAHYVNMLQVCASGLLGELRVTTEDEFYYAQHARNTSSPTLTRNGADQITNVRTSRIFHPLSLSETCIGELIPSLLCIIMTDVRHRKILNVEEIGQHVKRNATNVSGTTVNIVSILADLTRDCKNFDLLKWILDGVVEHAARHKHFPVRHILLSGLQTRNVTSFEAILKCCRRLLLSSVYGKTGTVEDRSTSISAQTSGGGVLDAADARRTVEAVLHMDVNSGARHTLEAVYDFIDEQESRMKLSMSILRSDDEDIESWKRTKLIDLLSETAALSPLIAACLGAELGRQLPYAVIEKGGRDSDASSAYTSELALAIVGTPVGYQSLCQHGWLLPAVECWHNEFPQYHMRVEKMAVFDGLTPETMMMTDKTRTDGGSYPLHLYGQLARTAEGCAVLSGVAADTIAESVTALGEHAAGTRITDDEDEGLILSRVWLLCHICASSRSFDLVDGDSMKRALAYISAIATSSSSLVVRSHCLCSLSLACSCVESRDVLQRCGWMTGVVAQQVLHGVLVHRTVGICIPDLDADIQENRNSSSLSTTTSDFAVLPSYDAMRVVRDFTEAFRVSRNKPDRTDIGSCETTATAVATKSDANERSTTYDAVMRGENALISAPGLRCLRHLSDMQNPVLEEEARASIAQLVHDDGTVLRNDPEFRRCVPLMLTRCRKLPHAVRREAWRLSFEAVDVVTSLH